ncbi:MAG TPA: hypothetical protein VFJ95_06240 [Gammaproteobacteria bacterium]|nr:hypothetical protein [Gammaproteobacteria bacterium]
MSERRTEYSDFEARAKHAFDESVAGIDAATRSRLTQARYRALQELDPARRSPWRLAPRGSFRAARWLPAGALAAAAFAALLLVWRGPLAPDARLEGPPLADLDILLGDEPLEMLDEDLEFYAWLEEQPEWTAPPAAGDGVG